MLGLFTRADIENGKNTRTGLLEEARRRMAQGIPAQQIWEEWLHVDRQGMDEQELNAYHDAMQELQLWMYDRNLHGRELEREGKIDDAIRLYEANVADHFPESFSYDRLRVIYLQRKKIDDAVRVCLAYIDLPLEDRKRKAKYRAWIKSIRQKKNT